MNQTILFQQETSSGSKREPSDAASGAKKKQKRKTDSSASKCAPPPADPSSSDNRTASSDVLPAGFALSFVASIAASSTDDKINEGTGILRELLDSNPNDIDVERMGKLLKWGVALVSTVSPCSKEQKRRCRQDQH